MSGRKYVPFFKITDFPPDISPEDLAKGLDMDVWGRSISWLMAHPEDDDDVYPDEPERKSLDDIDDE